jgi:hypothetical protein
VEVPISDLRDGLGPDLVVVVRRISKNDPKIAFKTDTILLNTVAWEQGGQIGKTREEKLIVTPPDAFNSSGLVSSGVHWCSGNGHYLEWSWGPLSEEGRIKEAVINLTLPVSNRIEGGPGHSANFKATIMDLSGDPLESGSIEMVNPFVPKSEMGSGGYGYDAYGVYRFSNQNIVKSGFSLRLEWLPLDEEYAFGGTIDRAILGFFLERATEDGYPDEVHNVSQILSNPYRYEGQLLRVEGKFYGWRVGLTDCVIPKTRSDWLIGEGGDFIYATGSFPPGLSPTNDSDIGGQVIVTGEIEVDESGSEIPCPYIVIEEQG